MGFGNSDGIRAAMSAQNAADDERAAIVAYLRQQAGLLVSPRVEAVVLSLAEDIHNGEHQNRG